MGRNGTVTKPAERSRYCVLDFVGLSCVLQRVGPGGGIEGGVASAGCNERIGQGCHL